MYFWYVSLLIEVLFVIHAIKRGHGTGWIFLILFFPLVGCIVYFVMVIVPELRGSRALSGATASLAKKMNPTRDLKRHMENLQVTGSIANKSRLAEECLAHGMYDEALQLYQESLTGAFKDDPNLLMGLATTYHKKGMHADARQTIEHIRSVHRDKNNGALDLLHAMVLEGGGDTRAALQAYESMLPAFTGPEAKCRYALLLQRTGEQEKARAVFHDIIMTAKRSPRFYRKIHKHWIDLAKKHS